MIYLKLFYNFFKIGLFTFGGGYAMLPLIQQAVVENGWLTEETFIDFVAVAESTPGPIAVNTATFAGKTIAGFFGAFCATLGVILPSFIVILIIAKFFTDFKDNKVVKDALNFLRPCVVGLVGAATLKIIISAVTSSVVVNETMRSIFSQQVFEKLGINIYSVIIFAIVFSVSRIKKKISPILLIVLSGILGVVFFI